jgi:hypothetical protein
MQLRTAMAQRSLIEESAISPDAQALVNFQAAGTNRALTYRKISISCGYGIT